MLGLFPPPEGISEIELEDHKCDLLRFLRARKFDVTNAESMLRETLDWRKEVAADDILNDPGIGVGAIDDTFHEVISHAFHKYDKLGRPVYFEKTGEINLAELTDTFSPEQLVRRHIWYMELQISNMRKSPQDARNGGTRRVEQMVHIVDLKGLSLMPDFSTINVFKETTHMDQTYYPERMGKMILIRAPTIFWALWKIVVPLLDSVTQDKILILGDDFQDTLLDIIDSDQLPPEYGGTCDCPNGCIHIHLHKEVNIKAGDSYKEIVPVSPGTCVSWAFQSMSHDIAFEVIQEDESGNEKVLSPKVRHSNAATTTIKGSTTAEAPGKVFVIFDNSYSYMKSKTVKYRIDVEQ